MSASNPKKKMVLKRPQKKIYYGETNCTALIASGKKKGLICTNGAYFLVASKYLCGVHSRSYSERVELEKNPAAKQNKADDITARQLLVDKMASDNKQAGRPGQLIVTKLAMKKAVEYVEGFLAVFPNIKHGQRADGFGCPNLSPMSLGPVKHFMPNLPVALTIENFHQFSKIYDFEIAANETKTIFKPEYVKTVATGFVSRPQRHKYSKTIIKENGGSLIPVYSLFYDRQGHEHRYSYLECRYFYRKMYEKLAEKVTELEELRNMLKNGNNLQIVGYDGYHVDKDLMTCYLDTSKPYGHELVLYTLLTITDPELYPWNIYYNQNREIYEGVAIDY